MVFKDKSFDRPKGTYIQKRNGKSYVYQYTEHKRIDSTKTKHSSKVIGILEDNRFYPNQNYFDLNNLEPSLYNKEILQWGYSKLYHASFLETGLNDLLLKTFDESITRKIEILSQYFVLKGDSISTSVKDWMEETFFEFDATALNSQLISKLYKTLGTHEDNLEKFKIDWFNKLKGEELIAYDVTSISTYSDNISMASMGYNRDKENLEQINLGMFCGLKSKKPAYYSVYDGSITDKTNLPYLLENVDENILNKVLLVLDAGFCEEKCLKKLAASAQSFIVGVPPERDFIKDYAPKNKFELVLSALNSISEHGEFGFMVDAELYGIKGRLLIGYNSAKHENLCSILRARIAKLEKELSSLKRMPKTSKIKRYEQYFSISSDEKGGFTYQLKEDVINEESKEFGFFYLFTNHPTIIAKDCLYFYRAKDCDEKLFYQLKVYLDNNRLRIHSDEALIGKTFVIFIAQIMRAHLYNKLEQNLKISNLTFEAMLKKMKNLKIATGEDKEKRFIKAPTKLQKEVFQVLNVNLKL